MSISRRPWATALVGYAIYRRTLSGLAGKRSNPRRTLMLRLLLVAMFMLVMPIAGPIFWHALLTMPTPLVVFVVSALVLRVVRWYWRRSR